MRPDIVNRLQTGKACFLLSDHDRDLAVPFIETWFFHGKDLFHETGFEVWFFPEPSHFLDGYVAQNLEGCEPASVMSVPADGLPDFVDWQGLIDELAKNTSLQDQGKFLSQRDL
ncbi:hypothetical protein GCM10010971_06740 [Silvimonas amylolytica]|uniref:Uncharacterized protein n=1 Tax=Silvimonas amylolytica TaxID=449663 RepID=A0ABQ2PHZ8_9NEIS|nr:hypothetical protein GCM10010971_06740 [Silvimonas amylolytica]